MVDVAVHIIIHGKVHGVCFRASTQIKALELNLIGWVRNLPSGTVEVHAEGVEIHWISLLNGAKRSSLSECLSM